MNRPQFQPEQAKEIARAFMEERVEYVFIGKSAAVLMGFPAVTQDVDGIENFENAKARSLNVEGFQVANLRDIIASKRASGREKDMIDLPLLEKFCEEFEKQNPAPLKSAADIVGK